MHVNDDAKKPASCVTAGIASIPAPTCTPKFQSNDFYSRAH